MDSQKKIEIMVLIQETLIANKLDAWQAFLKLYDEGAFKDDDEICNAFQWSYARGSRNIKRADVERIASYLHIDMSSDICMLEDIFQPLPDIITIYRGTSMEELNSPEGLNPSWSLNQGVAEYFAFEYSSPTGERIVLSATIDKARVLAVYDRWDEQEIVCLIGRDEAKIVCTEPTEKMYQFIKLREAKIAEQNEPQDNDWPYGVINQS